MMSRLIPALLVATALGACDAIPAQARAVQGPGAEPAILGTCFEPEDDCVALLVDQIGQARDEVLVFAYNFTHRAIFRALGEAAGRGVTVRVIIDRRREDSARIRALGEAGAEILVAADVRIQHNKVMIFDRRRLATGSQNFTHGATRNAENTLLIADPRTVAAYVDNWLHRAGSARAFQPPGDG